MTYRQKKISKGPNNMELTAIRPGMTLEEVERNLLNALTNSGVQVGGRRSAKKPSQQAESRDLAEKLESDPMSAVDSEKKKSEYREVEYRMKRYLVRGRIPKRNDLNPLGQFLAANHDSNKFQEYLVSYLRRSDPRPHTFKIDSCPLMTITEVTPTNYASIRDEERSGIRVDGYDPDGKASQRKKSRCEIERLMEDHGLTKEQAVRLISDVNF